MKTLDRLEGLYGKVLDLGHILGCAYLAAVALLMLLMAGCTIAGPMGSYDGSFTCKGKGVITGSGHLDLGAGVGGGQGNAFTVSVDCGEGMTITRDRARSHAEPVKP